jgi:LysM repeat protein
VAYTVRAGDTLSAIARSSASLSALAAANPQISEHQPISPGR